MPKPRIFIGSSAESLDVAYAAQGALEHDVEATVWPQGVFRLSRSTLENLTNIVEEMDFGLFVFAPDDVTQIRGETENTVRDNVVFELGLFVGRLGRFRTFILVPRGVELHLPSDLIGVTPATYDPQRQDNNLEAAIGPAAHQIRMEVRKLGPLPRPQQLPREQQAEVEVDEPTALPDTFFVPAPDWDQRTFERTFFLASRLGKADAAASIEAAFRKSPLATEPEAVAIWGARRELALIEAAQGGSLDEIRSIVRANPKSARLMVVLGTALTHYGDHPGAAKAYRDAAAEASEIGLASKAVRNAIEAEKELGEQVETESLVEFLRALPIGTPEEEEPALHALRDIAEVRELGQISLAIMERWSAVTPEDAYLKFSLAHKYSNLGRNELALWHYLAIPPTERGGAAWNNLGVVYNALDMPGEAVFAYKQAAEIGETIAEANLSDKLRIIGFFEEAQRYADAAVRRADYHANVVLSLEALRSAREAEAAAGVTATANGKAERSFRVKVGEAALAPGRTTIAGVWDTGECSIVFQEVGNGAFSGRGEFERKQNSVAGLFEAWNTLTSPTAPARTVVLEVTVKLVRLGDAFQGTISRRSKDEVVGLLGSTLAERVVLGYLEPSAAMLHVWEIDADPSAGAWTSQVTPHPK
jgi:Flp pilus assembly protein TadD